MHRVQLLSVFSYLQRKKNDRTRKNRTRRDAILPSLFSLTFCFFKACLAPSFLLCRIVLCSQLDTLQLPLAFELSFFLRGLSVLLFLCLVPRSFAFQPGSRINTVFAARFYANVIRLFAICPGKFCRRRFRVTLIGAHAFRRFHTEQRTPRFLNRSPSRVASLINFIP